MSRGYPPTCFSTVYLETTNGSLLHYRASPGFKHEIIRAFVNVIPRIRVIEQDSSQLFEKICFEASNTLRRIFIATPKLTLQTNPRNLCFLMPS